MPRNTVQRQIILEVLQQFKTHPTVEDVYREVHKTHPAISKVTVYRNLRLLSESGLARKILLPEQLERYDRRTDPHYHFVCKQCGAIIDVDVDCPDHIDEMVRSKYGFQVDEHDVVFKGLCRECGGQRT